MRFQRGRTVVLIVIAVLGAAIIAWLQRDDRPHTDTGPIKVGEALGDSPVEGYARAEHPRAFRFPEDHGPHPEFRNEWWYFTGNLRDAEGGRYGYQLTLFRIALAPGTPDSPSAWRTHQMYLGHFTITEVDAWRFSAWERYGRAALGLAGALANGERIWIDHWEVAREPGETGRWRIAAAEGDRALALRLEESKPVVLQGEQGLSRKSSERGNASYYYSIPRMATSGTITIDGTPVQVEGSSWLDREWSTSALAPDQEGWDWFALQLDDGRELMLYRLRRKDGSVDPASAGTLVGADGSAQPLAHGDVEVEVTDHWTSPASGTRYPAGWTLSVPSHGLTLRVKPLVPAQELMVSVRYWEGAVEAEGTGPRAVHGTGYVELVGY